MSAEIIVYDPAGKPTETIRPEYEFVTVVERMTREEFDERLVEIPPHDLPWRKL